MRKEMIRALFFVRFFLLKPAKAALICSALRDTEISANKKTTEAFKNLPWFFSVYPL